MSGNFFDGQFFAGVFFGVNITKVGGDDVPYRRKSPHKGFSKAEWKKRVKDFPDAVEKTLRETYASLTGDEAPISVLSQVDAIVRPVSKETRDRLNIDWQKMARDYERSNALMKLYREEMELQEQMEEEEELLLLASVL